MSRRSLKSGENEIQESLISFPSRAQLPPPGPIFKILSICKGGGYRYCRTEPPHPKANSKGLYPLHRVLAENKLGRLLSDEEIVHHKDEDKTNDSPDNLEVLKSHSEHSKIHGEHRRSAREKVSCAICGTEFELPWWVVKSRLAVNKHKGVACSKSCAAKLGWSGK